MYVFVIKFANELYIYSTARSTITNSLFFIITGLTYCIFKNLIIQTKTILKIQKTNQTIILNSLIRA